LKCFLRLNDNNKTKNFLHLEFEVKLFLKADT
jgi:hypothetical protein